MGYVASARGVRGEINIKALADPPLALLKCKEWRLVPSSLHKTNSASYEQTFTVQTVHQANDALRAKLKGIDDRNQAETLCGCSIYIDRSSFPQTAEDEFYWADLIGLEVWHVDDAGSELLGVIKNLIDTSAHAVLEIEAGDCASPSHTKPQPLLIPFIKVYIRVVDLAAKRVDVYWPKAWRDL